MRIGRSWRDRRPLRNIIEIIEADENDRKHGQRLGGMAVLSCGHQAGLRVGAKVPKRMRCEHCEEEPLETAKP